MKNFEHKSLHEGKSTNDPEGKRSPIFIVFIGYIEALGVWSLVVAATSLAQVSKRGFAGGIVRLVSKYVAREDAYYFTLAIETAPLGRFIEVDSRYFRPTGVGPLLGYPSKAKAKLSWV